MDGAYKRRSGRTWGGDDGSNQTSGARQSPAGKREEGEGRAAEHSRGFALKVKTNKVTLWSLP